MSLTKIIGVYASSNMYGKLCGALNTFVKPKLLKPELYGTWNAMALVALFPTFLHLGSRKAMMYQVPYYSALGDEERCQQIISDVYFGTMIPTTIVALGVLGYALLADLTLLWRVGLVVVAWGIVLQCQFDFRYDALMATKRFDVLSKVNMYRATLSLALNVALIWYFKLYGLFASFLAALVFSVFYCHRYGNIPIHRMFSFRRYLALIKSGLPIMLYNSTNELLSSMGNVVVATMLGSKQLGYYALTELVFHFLMQIPEDARDVMDPHMMHQVAEKNQDLIEQFFFTPLVLTAWLMPFLIGVSYYAVPLAVEWVLPDYLPSVPPIRIVVLGSFLYALAITCRGIIVANNQQARAAGLVAIALATDLGLGALFVKLGMGIEGVALAVIAAFLLQTFLLFTFVKRVTATPLGVFLRKISLVLPPALIMLGCIGAMLCFKPFPNVPMLSEVTSLVIFCVVMYASLYLASRRLPVLKRTPLLSFLP